MPIWLFGIAVARAVPGFFYFADAPNFAWVELFYR